ncbi:MAG: CvpA family protein [Patescibacteria group bacterium]
MLFTLVDLILVAILVFFAAFGFALGFIRTLGAVLGIIAGFWAASNFSGAAADWILPIFLGNLWAAKITAFVVVFILVDRLVGLIFWLVEKFFNLVSIIPFLKSINRLAGLVLGLVGGVLILGVAIFAVAKFGGNFSWLVGPLNGSKVAHALVWLTQFLTLIF